MAKKMKNLSAALGREIKDNETLTAADLETIEKFISDQAEQALLDLKTANEGKTAAETATKELEQEFENQGRTMGTLLSKSNTALDTANEQLAAVTAEKTAAEEKNTELQEQLDGATEKLSEAQKQNQVLTKEVPGTYKSKDGDNYRFKPGHLKTRTAKGIIDSTEVLKDSEEMERLIKIGYGGIEKVTK